MKNDLVNLITENYGKVEGIFIRGDIDRYVEKIIQKANIITYSSEGSIKGFIAYYSNDPKKEMSFLTMLLIDKKYRKEGIGSLLLKTSILDINSRGIDVYHLEVLRSNKRAVLFYESHGFKIEKIHSEKLKMVREIKKQECIK